MIVEHARTLWIKLTDPLESVTDGYMRQVARGSMVASLVTLIAILLLGSLRLFYDYATDTDITRIASHLIFIAVIVPTLATTYVLARHGALIAVIIILIVVVTLAIYVGALVGGAVKYGFYVSANSPGGIHAAPGLGQAAVAALSGRTCLVERFDARLVVGGHAFWCNRVQWLGGRRRADRHAKYTKHELASAARA